MHDAVASEEYSGLDVAIVGLAGRFPGAQNIKQFWQNLATGTESISFFTDDELRESGVDERFELFGANQIPLPTPPLQAWA